MPLCIYNHLEVKVALVATHEHGNYNAAIDIPILKLAQLDV